MYYFIFLIIGGVIGFLIAKAFQKNIPVNKKVFASKSEDELEEMREESREALSERTEKRKEKILELMRNERGKNAELTEKIESDEELEVCDAVVDRSPGITSDEVEKLLDVSDQTARKYLNELEDENKIEQVGDRGRGVYYILK